MNQSQESGLARSMTWFSRSLAVIGAFYLAPLVARHLRLDMFRWLAEPFGYDVAQWGSWIFVGAVVLAAGAGIATVFHLMLHALIRLGARRSVF